MRRRKPRKPHRDEAPISHVLLVMLSAAGIRYLLPGVFGPRVVIRSAAICQPPRLEEGLFMESRHGESEHKAEQEVLELQYRCAIRAHRYFLIKLRPYAWSRDGKNRSRKGSE